MKGEKILVIDDDDSIRKLLRLAILKAGGRVCTAASGEEGLRQLQPYQPDLIVLDIMMPDMNGWRTCELIRQHSGVPIIFLSALISDQDIIRGLDCGAVDYVTKPFSPRVLLARIRAALRQASKAAVKEEGVDYTDGYLTIDLDQRQVLVQGVSIKLSPKEHGLLTYLFQNAGRVLTFQQILEAIWGWEYQDNPDYVHVYISHLRRKLEENPKQPRYVLTEHGVGYRFAKPTA